jgi:hypothetical protein
MPLQHSNKKPFEMTLEELQIEKAWYQAKIDGPENNDRVTAYAKRAMNLDFWMDMVEDIDNELKSRLTDGTVENCSECDKKWDLTPCHARRTVPCTEKGARR